MGQRKKENIESKKRMNEGKKEETKLTELHYTLHILFFLLDNGLIETQNH